MASRMAALQALPLPRVPTCLPGFSLSPPHTKQGFPPAFHFFSFQGGAITGALRLLDAQPSLHLSCVRQEPAASFTRLTAGLINVSTIR